MGMDDRLPALLQASRLPWTPDLKHQSPAPAPNDSWAAVVGTLEWSILAHLGPDKPPSFLLALRNVAPEEDVQHVLTAYPSLHDAVTAAEATHSLLLEQLRAAVSNPT